MAGKRREGRILAAQFLYQREVGTSSIPLDEALKNLWEQTEAKPEACAFAEKRIRAVIEKQAEIDAELKKLVTNWDPSRMAPVDRAILRLALWEMKFADDVAPISALNEAIEKHMRIERRRITQLAPKSWKARVVSSNLP